MDIKKPQLVKVEAFAYFFEGVLQHPPLQALALKPYVSVVLVVGGWNPPLQAFALTPKTLLQPLL